MRTMTDPRCGKVSRANDQDGHCTKCHRTFSGENAFTAHQHLDGGALSCDDPETTLTPAGVLKFGPRNRPGTTDGVAWGLGPGWVGPTPWSVNPQVSDDDLTPEERRALLQIPTHTVDGERLAEWEREFLARELVKGPDHDRSI